WRVNIELDDALDLRQRIGKHTLDVNIEARQLVGIAPLYDREAVYSIRWYREYEKELRPGKLSDGTPDEGACLSATR
ncbi:MAG TPA: hypothetical protein VJO32_10600, partial [Ktedonobacteraceae bacterium]|nr:hypothetical protein [Ktedonobacteraceae bacterium]